MVSYTISLQQLRRLVAEEGIGQRTLIAQQVIWDCLTDDAGSVGGGLAADPAPRPKVLEKKNDAPKLAQRGRSRFTDQQLDDLWDRHNAGEKAPALAERFDCNVQAIYNLLSKMRKERGGNATAKKAQRRSPAAKM